MPFGQICPSVGIKGLQYWHAMLNVRTSPKFVSSDYQSSHVHVHSIMHSFEKRPRDRSCFNVPENSHVIHQQNKITKTHFTINQIAIHLTNVMHKNPLTFC